MNQNNDNIKNDEQSEKVSIEDDAETEEKINIDKFLKMLSYCEVYFKFDGGNDFSYTRKLSKDICDIKDEEEKLKLIEGHLDRRLDFYDFCPISKFYSMTSFTYGSFYNLCVDCDLFEYYL